MADVAFGINLWDEGDDAVERVFMAFERHNLQPEGDDGWLGHMARGMFGAEYIKLQTGDGKYMAFSDSLWPMGQP